MRASWSSAVILALLLCAPGCRGGKDSVTADLPDDAVARVGRDVVDARTVRRIASAQGVPVAEALEFAVSDALLAEAARARDGGERLERHAARAASARALLEQLAEEARRAGAPSDAELTALAEERWWELARPELRKCVHAVVRVKDPEKDAAARRLAERIYDSALDATEAEVFMERARSVDRAGLEVRVEKLLSAARDGRAIDLDNPPRSTDERTHYATEFTGALFAGEPHVVTRPFKTEFGYHVALVVEVTSPRRASRSELLERFEARVYADRARAKRVELLETLRQRTPPVVERAAMELTKRTLVFQ